MITPKNFPYPGDPSRNGEKIVFDILKEIYKDEKDFDIFYNREIWSPYNPNIPEEAEADFIIFHVNLGYVVIEVKGGNPVEYIAEENQWYSTDRNKIRHKIKNPVKQAKKCRWVIREKIKEVFKVKESPWINAKILVILPEPTFSIDEDNKILSDTLIIGFDSGSPNAKLILANSSAELEKVELPDTYSLLASFINSLFSSYSKTNNLSK